MSLRDMVFDDEAVVLRQTKQKLKPAAAPLHCLECPKEVHPETASADDERKSYEDGSNLRGYNIVLGDPAKYAPHVHHIVFLLQSPSTTVSSCSPLQGTRCVFAAIG